MSSPTPLATPPVPPDAVEALRRTVHGPVAYPGDPAYADLLDDHPDRPAVVVEATSEADVVAALVVADVHGLAVLVRTDRLDRVDHDPATGLVTLGAGTRWAALDPSLPDTSVLGPAPDDVEVDHLRTVRPDGFVLLAPATPLPDGVITGVVVRPTTRGSR